MSRGNSSTWRPVAVWSVVTAAAGAAAGAVPGAWASRTAAGPHAFADLLVATCATGLALALVWLWVITTLTVGGVLSGSARAGGGATRRLVLVACGAAVLAGTGAPALAAGGDGSEVLVGLPLPERTVAPPQRTAPSPPDAPAEARPQPDAQPKVQPQVQPQVQPGARREVTGDGTYVVRRGDSLWSIARRHPGDSGSVDLRWRAIWQANRDVVGDDPDLIHPGQALRLPDGAPDNATDNHQAHDRADDTEDGDR